MSERGTTSEAIMLSGRELSQVVAALVEGYPSHDTSGPRKNLANRVTGCSAVVLQMMSVVALRRNQVVFTGKFATSRIGKELLGTPYPEHPVPIHVMVNDLNDSNENRHYAVNPLGWLWVAQGANLDSSEFSFRLPTEADQQILSTALGHMANIVDQNILIEGGTN